LLYLSLMLTIFLRFGVDFNLRALFDHLVPFSILFLFWLIIFYIFGLYDLNAIKTKFAFPQKILGALLICLLLGMIFFYMIPFFGISPKINLMLNLLIFAILFTAWRNFFYFLFSSYFLNNIAILGTGEMARELAKEIEKRPYLGYKMKAFIESESLFKQNDRIGEIKMLNAGEGLFLKIQERDIDTIIIAEELTPNSFLAKELYDHLPSSINFISLIEAYEIICGKIPISFVKNLWFLENLKQKQLHNKLKRIIDVALASLMFVVSLPLWLILAVLIKIEDKGPVFYCQKRVGKNKKTFTLIKFRSMKQEAEKTGPVWAKQEDPRTTKIGEFLRKSHLDELPQMINIIKGDISLVGPRPERPEFVKQLEKQIPHYHIRHLIKPGFTGWAQLNFRYARTIMDSFEKFQYDLYYLKNRSLALDLRILLKTFQLFFRSE